VSNVERIALFSDRFCSKFTREPNAGTAAAPNLGAD
jgi:hypothetical protein